MKERRVSEEQDSISENLPEYDFDLLDAAQRLLQKLDGISTTAFERGAEVPEREALRKVIEQITGKSGTTPLSSQRYAECHGVRCPRCLSESLTKEPVERLENGIIEKNVRCLLCAAHWMEVYRLEGYTDLGI
jgi:hypothetical protein